MAKYVNNFRGEIDMGGKNFRHHNFDYLYESDFGNVRKSKSMNDIAALREDLEELDHEDKDAYHFHRKLFGSSHELSKRKFVSMAEAIYKLQRDTYCIFHMKQPQILRSRTPNRPSRLTVPQALELRSKTRLRQSHVLSRQEREEMELEEIRKYKFKASPIPKSVIEGTKNLPEVTKKPLTVPEPFKLTETRKKINLPIETPKFKARPAPKHILNKPHFPVKRPMHVIKPIKLKFCHKRANAADQLKSDNLPLLDPQNKPKKEYHKPEPISCVKRNEELKRHREERIKRQIEEKHKQATLFKAQPVPEAVKKLMHCTASKASTSATSSVNKKSFNKPVLQQIKDAPFEQTEKHATERKRYDKELKEKEEEQGLKEKE